LLTTSSVRPPETDWLHVPELVRALDRPGMRAVVGYGSWYAQALRKPASFPDVYLVVDAYRPFHTSRLHAWMNHVLPPNVYFLWSGGDGHRAIHGKYNVISMADLARECSVRLRDVYNAGRLTKVIWIAWSRDATTADALVTVLLEAHCTLTPLALALMPERVDVDAFSLELLALSYRGEARLEGWDRVRALHAVHAEHYRALHRTLLEAFGEATGLLAADGVAFRRCDESRWLQLRHTAWRLLRRSRRRGYLRWPRIVLTEPNLLDLAVNEAERKAGVHIRVTPRLRRHPLLYGFREFVRVLRERRSRERIV
jgi:hypothetical protein